MTPITVNSDRLFSKIRRYFGDNNDLLREALQNSYRSGATKIHVTWDSDAKNLCIRDNGKGITDFGAALSIANSGWDETIEANQDPAGMGLCGVLSQCVSVELESNGRRLSVDSGPFFESAAYRASLADQYATSPVTVGTQLTCRGLTFSPDFTKAVEPYPPGLVQVTVDGEDVRIEAIEERFEDKIFENDDFAAYTCKTKGYTYSTDHGILWHGLLLSHPSMTVNIDVTTDVLGTLVRSQVKVSGLIGTHLGKVVIKPKRDGIVTPKLPDRHVVVEDAKAMAIYSPLCSMFEARRLDKLVLSVQDRVKVHRDAFQSYPALKAVVIEKLDYLTGRPMAPGVDTDNGDVRRKPADGYNIVGVMVYQNEDENICDDLELDNECRPVVVGGPDMFVDMKYAISREAPAAGYRLVFAGSAFDYKQLNVDRTPNVPVLLVPAEFEGTVAEARKNPLTVTETLDAVGWTKYDRSYCDLWSELRLFGNDANYREILDEIQGRVDTSEQDESYEVVESTMTQERRELDAKLENSLPIREELQKVIRLVGKWGTGPVTLIYDDLAGTVRVDDKVLKVS